VTENAAAHARRGLTGAHGKAGANIEIPTIWTIQLINPKIENPISLALFEE
jgi:hypothetical protein